MVTGYYNRAGIQLVSERTGLKSAASYMWSLVPSPGRSDLKLDLVYPGDFETGGDYITMRLEYSGTVNMVRAIIDIVAFVPRGTPINYDNIVETTEGIAYSDENNFYSSDYMYSNRDLVNSSNTLVTPINTTSHN